MMTTFPVNTLALALRDGDGQPTASLDGVGLHSVRSVTIQGAPAGHPAVVTISLFARVDATGEAVAAWEYCPQITGVRAVEVPEREFQRALVALAARAVVED